MSRRQEFQYRRHTPQPLLRHSPTVLLPQNTPNPRLLLNEPTPPNNSRTPSNFYDSRMPNLNDSKSPTIHESSNSRTNFSDSRTPTPTSHLSDSRTPTPPPLHRPSPEGRRKLSTTAVSILAGLFSSPSNNNPKKSSSITKVSKSEYLPGQYKREMSFSGYYVPKSKSSNDASRQSPVSALPRTGSPILSRPRTGSPLLSMRSDSPFSMTPTRSGSPLSVASSRSPSLSSSRRLEPTEVFASPTYATPVEEQVR